jgi:two-component system chemotaxis sensor kinase CheA
LSGSVVVESQVGVGTSFRITLPLTMVIMQAMLVTVAETVYAIPLAGVNELLALNEHPVTTVKGKPTIHWQETTLPLLDLRQCFAVARPDETSHGTHKRAVVTVAWGKLRAGLLVDRILGQQEIVIKSLSPLLGRLPGVSGGAILGDGRIALIVDIPHLMNWALQARRIGEAR